MRCGDDRHHDYIHLYPNNHGLPDRLDGSMTFFEMALMAEEYTQFVREEFVDVMRQRGHQIEIFGDEIMTGQV